MLIKKLQEYMRLKNYSQRTIKVYTICAKVLYSRFKKSLRKINKQEFENFLRTLISKSRSPYTINQYQATLKLVFERIYKIPFNLDIRYVQELLGHQNIRTTQRYSYHILKLDNLFGNIDNAL